MPTYNDALEAHFRTLFSPEDDLLARIRAGIEAHGMPTITVKPEEGRFLQFLAAACGARLALEIGTLGGYSSTWIMRGLQPEGRLITLEREAERAELAREHFALAGLAERVEVLVGDAHLLLPRLTARAPFDFVFIDAEKEGYPAYLAWAAENLRPGGVLAAHNAFRHGKVVEPGQQDAATQAMRAFNQRLAQDPRWIASLYPGGDGLAIAVRRREG